MGRSADTHHNARMRDLVKDGDTLHLVVGRDVDEDWGHKLHDNTTFEMRRIPCLGNVRDSHR